MTFNFITKIKKLFKPKEFLKVKVTREHIEKGEVGHPLRCPIAWAVREKFPNSSFVCVDYNSIISGENGSERYHLPFRARCFVHNFDCRRPVDPFTFKATKNG